MIETKIIPSRKYLEWREKTKPQEMSVGEHFVHYFCLTGIITDPSKFAVIQKSTDERAPFLILPLVDWAN